MPKPKYQQIIWDWNGTLLNDAWLCYEITSEQLKALDHPGLTFDEYRDTFGHTVYDFYRRIGVNISRSKFSELAERFHSRYLERLSECSLHEGILDILSEFQKLGISQYILSAHPEDLLLKTIEKHGISHFFSGISGQKNNLGEGKLDLVSDFVKINSIKPEAALFIGDTDHDLDTARAIGCDCILIPLGLQSHKKLADFNMVIKDHYALKEILFS